jgi:hypothetical protein
MLTTETSFIDPVYKGITFGVSLSGNNFTTNEIDKCQLVITKSANSRRDNQSIIKDVSNIFTTYFSREQLRLGQVIDLRFLNQEILSVNGVENFVTARTDTPNNYVQGLSLFSWNPQYPNTDSLLTQNNITTKYFEYCYFNNLNSINSKISVVTTTNTAITTIY